MLAHFLCRMLPPFAAKTSWDAWRAAVLLGAAAVMALPLLLTDVPLLADYPQHVARAHLLVNLSTSPELARYYEVQNGLVPYFGWDAMAVPLTYWLGAYRAGQVGLVLVFVLLTGATLTLQRVVQGAVRWEAAAVLLCLYNTLLAWGNITYLPGAALAVFALAGWIHSAEWPILKRVAIFSVISAFLFLAHLVALGAFALLAMAFELGRLWRLGMGAVLCGLSAAGVQFVLPAMLWLMVGPSRENRPTIFMDLSHHLYAFASPLGFDRWLGQAPSAGAMVDLLLIDAVVVALYAGVRSGRLRLMPALRWPLAVGAVVSLVMPVMVLSIFGMHLRLPIVLACVLVAGLRVDWPSQRHGVIAALGLGMLLALRFGVVAGQMADCAPFIDEMRTALEAMPLGARLLPVIDKSGDGRGLCRPNLAFEHVAMLALIDRSAFVASIFDHTTIVNVRPPLTMADDIPPLSPANLHEGTSRPPVPRPNSSAEAALGWSKNYTHVLWVHLGQPVEPVPDGLQPLHLGAQFNLYAVMP